MLLFSAGLATPGMFARAAEKSGDGALHLFFIGDWGTGDASQKSVAAAMQTYARANGVTPHALFMLGDNFYGALSGPDSPRWKNEFEEMYPASVFPGACHALLGNHDYDDQPGGELFQLAYARKAGTRWRMPARWYRLDLPEEKPVATFLCTDTHFAKLSRKEIAAQAAWLKAEFARARTTPWIFVCGHHPVYSVGTEHGNTPELSPWRELFPREKVAAYICGHEHDLQHLRNSDDSTDWFISGAGGRALYPVKAGTHASFAQSAFGFLHMAVGARSFEAKFIGQNADALYQYERKAVA